MDLKTIIESIVSTPQLHAKWLNTLSMMENSGARKISASEHSQKVDLTILKHAAEEARHAYYLKSQLRKLPYEGCETYELNEILAPISSYQYLNALDSSISRYLRKNFSYSGHDLRYASYLLVTYAIEVRADELYPIYEDVLKENSSGISVRMIIAEEKGHLEEMIIQMEHFFSDWKEHGAFALNVEKNLFQKWKSALAEEIEKYNASLQENSVI